MGFIHQTQMKNLFSKASRAAATYTSSVIDVSQYEEGLILIDVDTVGTSATLTPTVQIADDKNGPWFDHPTTIAAISTVSQKAYSFTNIGHFMRVSAVVATAAVDFSIDFLGKT